MAFDNELQNLVDLIFNPLEKGLVFDKDFYNFNREEKDMAPLKQVKKDDKIILTHNVLGINKEDLKVKTITENGKTFITIEGKTKDEYTGKEYSVNSRFQIDDSNLDLSTIKSKMKNGLIYLEINYKKAQKKENIIKID